MSTAALNLTGAVFEGLARRLSEFSDREVLCLAGVSRLPECHAFLARQLASLGNNETEGEPPIVFVAVTHRDGLQDRLRRLMNRPRASLVSALVVLGIGEAAGSVAGVCLTPAGVRPLEEVTVVTAGLPRIGRSEGQPGEAPSARPMGFEGSRETHARSPVAREDEIWSRTIGALGEACWQKLVSLRYGLIGCGRTGSLVASSLVGLGVNPSQLILIDEDTLQIHNLGEMQGVCAGQAGEPKADALAEAVSRRARELRPAATLDVFPLRASARAVPESVLGLSALTAVKQTDLLISCVDSSAGRLTTTILSTLYLLPLLDVGTGIFGHSSERRMGSDVRLVVPGERCLLCLGGLAQLGQARDMLRRPLRREVETREEWRQHRSGSLNSLNQLATGLGFRLLEDFMARRLRQSTWLHLEIDADGIPRLEHRPRPPDPACELCKLTGLGDLGIGRLPAFLERLSDR